MGRHPLTNKEVNATSRRRDLVAYKGGVCERCNASPLYVAFDFHHKDPEQKKFPLSQRNMARKWGDLIKEADKCHLLCANCHRIVHFKREAKFLK
jgi:predicted HNH restriction endonuclease